MSTAYKNALPPPAPASGTYALDYSALREAISAERTALQERLNALQTAEKLVETLAPPTDPKVRLEGSKLDWMRAVLVERPGLTAGGLREAMAEKGQPVSSEQLHTYLWRLQKRGLVHARGERPGLRYYATPSRTSDKQGSV